MQDCQLRSPDDKMAIHSTSMLGMTNILMKISNTSADFRYDYEKFTMILSYIEETLNH